MRRLLTTLALIFGFSTASFGQAANINRVFYLTPKADMQTQFETALKQHAQWRKDNGDPWAWEVFQVINGQNMGDYIVISGGHKWSDFDDYNDFRPKGYQHFAANVAPLVESATSAISATDTTIVRGVEGEYPLRQIIYFKLAPGKTQQFVEAVGQYHKAFTEKDHPNRYAVIWNVNGGDFDVLLSLPYENWAAFAGPDTPNMEVMQAVYGEEAGAIAEAFNTSITESRSIILMSRPDLSGN